MPDGAKRAIIFIAAILILLGIAIPSGVAISNSIENKYKESAQKYENAIVIEDKEKFERYLNLTENSCVLIKSPIKAVDVITDKDIDGEYIYLRKEFQKYVDDGYYNDGKWVSDWKWKTKDRIEKKTKELKICGTTLPYSYFSNLPWAEQIEIIDTGYHTRCVYYGIPAEINGTSFAEIGNGSIVDENITFYPNKEPSQVIESKNNLNVKVIFWFFWSIWSILIIACGAFLFYLLFLN